ncbi:MAG: 16S rRNA (guanine(527)-N(7))-methyltransferase RsmG [Hydrogenophilus sp.]|nr:16S rRNA (guanine(527)-N(7))-methyltransferase RsmG [Hydrogenophilus sp.]
MTSGRSRTPIAEDSASASEWAEAERRLRLGLPQLVPALNGEQLRTAVARLLAYTRLLLKWNRVYSLTAVSIPSAVAVRHLLDSVALWPWVAERDSLLDVGSGAGLPAVPVAVVAEVLDAPALKRVVALEAVGKKGAFLEQCRIELGLSRLRVVVARAEEWQSTERFAAITARAVGPIATWVGWTRHLLAAEGCWFAFKGNEQEAAAEIAALPQTVRVVALQRIEIPFLPEARTMVVLAPTERESAVQSQHSATFLFAGGD